MSNISDPYGRTLASMNHYTTNDRVMVTLVPIQRVPTIYALVGDQFGWLAVLGFVGIAGWGIFRGRKMRTRSANL